MTNCTMTEARYDFITTIPIRKVKRHFHSWRMKGVPCSLPTPHSLVPKVLWLRNAVRGSVSWRPSAHRHEVMVRLITLRRQCWRKLLAWGPISLQYSFPIVKDIYSGMRKTEQHPRLAPMAKPRWWTESPHERLGTGRRVERQRKNET